MSKKTTTINDLSDLKAKKKESWIVFDQIAPTYDLLNRILSFGIDKRWRKNFKRFLPKQKHLKCLDLATGTGDVAIELARDDRVDFVEGTDLSIKMIEFGREKLQNKKFADKITLKLGDGVNIPNPSSSIDIITVAFGVRNFSDHRRSLKNMVRVLKPKGQAMILEFSLPKNYFIRTVYLFYFRTILPKIGNLLSKHGDAYTYLNKTVEDFPYGEAFISDMKNAGFKKVKTKSLSFGIATLYIGHK
jgi:demethylmenaquinone methyltransferase / 2-methoxy-6-polyprenyl-1,4-benzoquinol methylase